MPPVQKPYLVKASRCDGVRFRCSGVDSVLFLCVTATLQCPLCNGVGVWRKGVGFDHERRCGDCSVYWEPGSVYYVVKPEFDK